MSTRDITVQTGLGSLRRRRGGPAVSGVPRRPSGGAQALGQQVDEGVAGLSQVRDGHPAPLPHEAGHGVQLLLGDGDELPPVVNHSWRQAVVMATCYRREDLYTRQAVAMATCYRREDLYT